jgi:hypothetical protein
VEDAVSAEVTKRVYERRCEACDTVHSIFETCRDTGGMAVASEEQRVLCQQCGALLFESTVKDSDFLMALRSDDPEARRMREALRREERSLGQRWRRFFERAHQRWFEFDIDHPYSSQLSLFVVSLLLASALVYAFVFR